MLQWIWIATTFCCTFEHERKVFSKGNDITERASTIKLTAGHATLVEAFWSLTFLLGVDSCVVWKTSYRHHGRGLLPSLLKDVCCFRSNVHLTVSELSVRWNQSRKKRYRSALSRHWSPRQLCYGLLKKNVVGGLMVCSSNEGSFLKTSVDFNPHPSSETWHSAPYVLWNWF